MDVNGTGSKSVLQAFSQSVVGHAALFVLVVTVLAGVSGAAEYDLSYSPLQNGSAESGLKAWKTTGDISISSGGVEGSRCFKLAAGETGCTLASEPVSVRRGESFRLSFQHKSEDGPGIVVQVRSWGADRKTLLSSRAFNFGSTQNKWRRETCEFTASASAFYADVVFELPETANGSLTVLLDDISLWREIKYAPLYADVKPLKKGDTLYVFTKGGRSENNVFVAAQTLQGITARTDRPRLWIDAGDDTFVKDLQEQYGIVFDRSLSRDFPAMLEKLKPYTSGTYVLYDMRDKPSLSAAATLSGVLDAVAVDTNLEPAAVRKGYTKAADVRGKDCRWVYENYRAQINDDLLIVHTNDSRFHGSAFHLKDWATATKALSWWYDDEKLSREVYRSMAPCSPVYGWLDASTHDEGLSVKLHSEEGLFQIPSDWMLNLSVHASMGRALKDKTFRQKVERKAPVKEQGVHYVTFIMSDMDNILTEIGTNSFFSTRKFYRNENRGTFPMTWGMAPPLTELSPNGVDLWYRHATEKDAFVAYCSLGYSYPASSPYMQTHAKRLGEMMERADLQVLLIIDYLLPDRPLDQSYYETAKWFTALDQVSGMIYLEYIQYAPHGGKIFWFDGKPMVTARYDLRDETFYPAVRPTAKALAESINALPKDPSSPDGYTAVTVHAWSKGMDDIAETVRLLDSNVRVVQAEEFIELICANMKK
jgi:hypothetical protein